MREVYWIVLMFVLLSGPVHGQNFSFFPESRVENPVEIGLILVSEEFLTYIYVLADDTFFAYQDFQNGKPRASLITVLRHALGSMLSNFR